MLQFQEKTKKIVSTAGGYSAEGVPIRDTFVQLSQGMNFQRGIFYEPEIPTDKSHIGIVILHADADYSTWNICGEMAKRGYRTLGSSVTDRSSTLDEKLLDIKRCVEFLRAVPDITRVILMGHSGGATLMTAYQRAAENGIASLQGDDMLIKLSLKTELPAADGLMTLDSNWGNGSMTLFSIDPAVTDDSNGILQDSDYDYFTVESGYAGKDTRYTPTFLRKYFQAQARRNNAIVEKALARLKAIESGTGNYVDDEPFCIAGASQVHPCNRLFPQDTHLLSHTKEKHDLIHKDGSITNEVVYSLRGSHVDHSPTSIFALGTAAGTVRTYLTEHAVFAAEDYSLNEDGVTGVDCDRTYNCPPGNVKHITAPLLCMGMTGSYEYLAAEVIYNNSASTDKTIAFVEGATHNFTPNTEAETYPGQFGDTEKLLFDYVDRWLSKKGRFI